MHSDRVQLEIFPSAEAMATSLAQRWLTQLRSHSQGTVRIALSGGRVAAAFQKQASEVARQSGYSWAGVHFFWGDERCVPPDHADSNFRAAHDALLHPCNIPASQIHRLRGELPPDEAAILAREELKAICPIHSDGWPVLDLIMLGMGEDGHVASLFPNTPDEISMSSNWVIPVIGPKPPPQRLSLTFGVLAAAREVWVLASGADKAPAFQASTAVNGTTPLAKLLQMRSRTVLAVEKTIIQSANA